MNWLANLKKMLELSQQLLGLAQLGAQALKPGEVSEQLQTEAVEQLWQKRARLAGELKKVSHRLLPVWENWPQSLQALEQAQQQRVLIWMADIRANGNAIKKLDAKSKSALERMLSQAQQELVEINHISKALQAYRPAVFNNGQSGLPVQLSRTT